MWSYLCKMILTSQRSKAQKRSTYRLALLKIEHLIYFKKLLVLFIQSTHSAHFAEHICTDSFDHLLRLHAQESDSFFILLLFVSPVPSSLI